MDKNKIIIFDTTLRDGEQSPGASMNTEEKIRLALQLEKLGVDVIEAGFAAASPGDFDAINQIAKATSKIRVCSLSRALENDIKAAAQAIAPAKFQRIHTFIATSPIHMEFKLKMKPDEVIKRAVAAVQYAKTFTDDVEFSCEDACRSDVGFMKEICEAVIGVGATTINLPDTVGYRLPNEIYAIFKQMVEFINGRAIVSAHNHNDLGLATANTLACIEAGARQVECTINGLGERAGNTALEEIAMVVKTRNDHFSPLYTDINFKEIYPSSRLVASITGIEPQPNKAIVGKNAFAHESGIHQDGVLKHRETYEIMKADDIGLDKNSLVLGKHSGRHAFKDKLIALGYELDDEQLQVAFEKFKILADSKKDVYDEDLRELVNDEFMGAKTKAYEIALLSSNGCNKGHASAAVTLNHDEILLSDSALGNGGVDAIFKAIDRISKVSGELKDYQVKAVSKGKDALAKVTVKVEFEGTGAIMGHGLDVDTMLASAKAYVGALNTYLASKK